MNVLSWWRNLKRLNARCCVLCHDSVPDGLYRGYANDLTEYFIDAAQSCPLCFRHVTGGAVCDGRQEKPSAFDRMWASLYYEPPVSSMIRELKCLADLGTGRPLADLMCQNASGWLAAEHFDFVLPMPLSKERWLKRGFNQNEALTDILARRYGWTLLPCHAVFRRHGEPQGTLKSGEHRRNIKNAFKIKAELPKACNILLIDDVFTTGSTLDELTEMLKKSGAGKIFCWSLARSPMKK